MENLKVKFMIARNVCVIVKKKKEGTHGKLWLVGVTIEGGHWSERTVSVVIVGWLVSRARVVLGKKRTSCAATLVWLLGWQAHWFVRK